MDCLLLCLAILQLAIIFIQDLRYREVWVLLFPSLFVTVVSRELLLKGHGIVLANISVNFSLLVFQLVLVYIVLHIKHKLTTHKRGFIGLGDILLLTAITPLFSPIHYQLFLFIGCFISFIFWKVFNQNMQSIPLAGLLSVFLIAVLVWARFMDYSINDDSTLFFQYTTFLLKFL